MRKRGLVLTILIVFILLNVSLTLFLTPKKVKADTISDLTGTTWVLNTSFTTLPNGYTFTNYNDTFNYVLRFTSNNTNYTSLNFYGVNTTPGIGYGGTLVWDYNSNIWTNQAYRTITITGGAAAHNAALITWFQNNARQPGQGTEITHEYWAPNGIITMSDNQVVGDNEIQYTVLFNQFTDTYTDTTQTGLIFKGVQTTQTPTWSYIESINGDGINLLYHGETNNIDNTMWLEFTTGDYMDDDLYNFMSNWGTWFDDANAYLVGINQGYVEGVEHGRALGQADGVEYTGLVTGIFNGLGNILSIQVFPNITIGLLIGLPLLLGAFIIIIKILRG